MTPGTRARVRLPAGFALMEETTAFRLDWNRFSPPESAAINALTLRIIYSMGPHKAHQLRGRTPCTADLVCTQAPHRRRGLRPAIFCGS
ncbi:MAG: hypothetical protein U0527_15115 [Candidatus Eisenbacteria bacterium]